jgi:hypothetical protein
MKEPEHEFETELMVCVDGGEHASIPLRDGDDRFNAEAERGALDRAYEAKESNPDSVVSIVVCRVPVDAEVGDGEVEIRLSRRDAVAVAEAVGLLAGIDEGENTDRDDLIRLSQAVQDQIEPPAPKLRTVLTALFDVTDLTEEERGQLAAEVAVQSERSDGHPTVDPPELDWITYDEDGGD